MWIKRSLIVFWACSVFAWSNAEDRHFSANDGDSAEARAVFYLTREVPGWSKNNHCFSCHNDGDAARALYAATRKGHTVPATALAPTTAWLAQPLTWESNKGDPGFSDKRLATVQFAVALFGAFEAGFVKDPQVLRQAARKLLAEQSTDGAWHIEPENAIGSPATWGTALATVMVRKALQQTRSPETAAAIQRAERWLNQTSPTDVPAAAALLMAAAGGGNEADRKKQQDCLQFLRAAQTRDGGWGPYRDAPPEPFDTAVVLLALSEMRRQPGLDEMIRRGRAFLMREQNTDGSWPETTRPSGSESYAQRLSTTGWATLALLATK